MKVAVVTCMDCRIDVETMLGVEPGQIHVIRNAGGLVTSDTIRTLAASQRSLGTEYVMLIQHTDCGMSKTDDEVFLAELEKDTGQRPTWRPGVQGRARISSKRYEETARQSVCGRHCPRIRPRRKDCTPRGSNLLDRRGHFHKPASRFATALKAGSRFPPLRTLCAPPER